MDFLRQKWSFFALWSKLPDFLPYDIVYIILFLLFFFLFWQVIRPQFCTPHRGIFQSLLLLLFPPSQLVKAADVAFFSCADEASSPRNLLCLFLFYFLGVFFFVFAEKFGGKRLSHVQKAEYSTMNKNWPKKRQSLLSFKHTILGFFWIPPQMRDCRLRIKDQLLESDKEKNVVLCSTG